MTLAAIPIAYLGRMVNTAVRERPAQSKPDEQRNGHDVDWSLLSPQGRVLFYIALCPSCSVEEMAVALDLTERSVWTIIRSLRQQDLVHYRRDGRRHRYAINLDGPLLAPTIEGLTLRPVLGGITDEVRRDNDANCVRIE